MHLTPFLLLALVSFLKKHTDFIGYSDILGKRVKCHSIDCPSKQRWSINLKAIWEHPGNCHWKLLVILNSVTVTHSPHVLRKDIAKLVLSLSRQPAPSGRARKNPPRRTRALHAAEGFMSMQPSRIPMGVLRSPGQTVTQAVPWPVLEQQR